MDVELLAPCNLRDIGEDLRKTGAPAWGHLALGITQRTQIGGSEKLPNGGFERRACPVFAAANCHIDPAAGA